MTDPLELSILIVNWNVRDLLRDCLDSLLRRTRLPAERYEVIVVDNASADDSTDMLRREFPSVRLIASETNLGFVEGCQVAYDASRGTLILLLNPDTVVLDGAIDRMLEDMKGHLDAGIIGSRLLNRDGSFQRAGGGAFPTLAGVAWNYLFFNRFLPRRWGPPPVFLEDDRAGISEIDWVSGAALMFRRDIVGERIFNRAYFMFGEDMELCDRVRRQGWKILYSANQSIIHYHGESMRKQSSAEVLSTIYKGPRTFFKQRNGPVTVFCYDAVLLAGFLMRWAAAGMLSPFVKDRDYAESARFSRQFIMVMLRSMSAKS